MSKRNKIIALLIPIFIIVGSIGKSEYQLATGETWKFKISGYDPRDLLRGHYVMYQVEFDWGEGEKDCADKKDCCLCLTRKKDSLDLAKVSKMSCSIAADRCDGLMREEYIQELRKYFIPEDKGKVLEKAIREKNGEILVTINDDGHPVVRDLLVDGITWLKAIKN
jgi:uncharacterized membrane-anchored protein